MAQTCGLVVIFLYLLGKPTNCKEANVTCIIHDDCILPCGFGPVGTVVIHWYKQQIPVHSFYYNKDQFGLQNKHFSGRTGLFNSQIVHGNASLLLKRVKVQDKGRYKCYTSTRKGNQETFVNLEVKALIHSVTMEASDEAVSCSSHSIYPLPQVAWATDPPSPAEALRGSFTKTVDHKGLFSVASTLRILGNLSDQVYFCSFISADRTQVWTASHKNQADVAEEDGREVSIPCVAPHRLRNFSLTWTFSGAPPGEPSVILRYDSRSGRVADLWDGRAELDAGLASAGDGSLRLRGPHSREHTGTYTCTFSGLQSRHVVRTRVNITAPAAGVEERPVERLRWCTVSSVSLVLLTVLLALPHYWRHKAIRGASCRHNGAGLDHAAMYASAPPAVRISIQRLPPQQHDGGKWEMPKNCSAPPPPDAGVGQAGEEGRAGPPNDGPDGVVEVGSGLAGSIRPGLHASGREEATPRAREGDTCRGFPALRDDGKTD